MWVEGREAVRWRKGGAREGKGGRGRRAGTMGRKGKSSALV